MSERRREKKEYQKVHNDKSFRLMDNLSHNGKSFSWLKIESLPRFSFWRKLFKHTLIQKAHIEPILIASPIYTYNNASQWLLYNYLFN